MRKLSQPTEAGFVASSAPVQKVVAEEPKKRSRKKAEPVDVVAEPTAEQPSEQTEEQPAEQESF